MKDSRRSPWGAGPRWDCEAEDAMASAGRLKLSPLEGLMAPWRCGSPSSEEGPASLVRRASCWVARAAPAIRGEGGRVRILVRPQRGYENADGVQARLWALSWMEKKDVEGGLRPGASLPLRPGASLPPLSPIPSLIVPPLPPSLLKHTARTLPPPPHMTCAPLRSRPLTAVRSRRRGA